VVLKKKRPFDIRDTGVRGVEPPVTGGKKKFKAKRRGFNPPYLPHVLPARTMAVLSGKGK